MQIIAILIPISLLLAAGWVLVYLWLVKTGQFDDLELSATKILFEEEQFDPEPKDRSRSHRSKSERVQKSTQDKATQYPSDS